MRLKRLSYIKETFLIAPIRLLYFTRQSQIGLPIFLTDVSVLSYFWNEVSTIVCIKTQNRFIVNPTRIRQDYVSASDKNLCSMPQCLNLALLFPAKLRIRKCKRAIQVEYSRLISIAYIYFLVQWILVHEEKTAKENLT
jgi:hypothetical protein